MLNLSRCRSQVAFHENFKQILPVNYNEDAHSSYGYFGYENGRFKYNSTYFDDVSSADSADRSAHAQDPRPTEPDWSLYCDNCYMYYLPEVLL